MCIVCVSNSVTVCCPSRSELVTGRYLHNVKLPVDERQCGEGYAGSDAGSINRRHVYIRRARERIAYVDKALVNNRTVALFLQRKAGYTVGVQFCIKNDEFCIKNDESFGRNVREYLNNCPTAPAPGFDAEVPGAQ